MYTWLHELSTHTFGIRGCCMAKQNVLWWLGYCLRRWIRNQYSENSKLGTFLTWSRMFGWELDVYNLRDGFLGEPHLNYPIFPSLFSMQHRLREELFRFDLCFRAAFSFLRDFDSSKHEHNKVWIFIVEYHSSCWILYLMNKFAYVEWNIGEV